jgi:hypothetical protein
MHQKLKEFADLLDRQEREQEYQAALEATPRLIPQEFVQNHGVHFSLIFRKLRLAENYTTDFFYLSKSSGDWNAVFIEIEKPSSRYFKDGCDEFHPDFLAGLSQINRWRAWLQTPGNADHMFSETLEPIWHPHPMRRNPRFYKFVLVTGRRSEYQNDDRKSRLINGVEREDFKIISYDSLLDGATSNQDVYAAIRENSHIKIITPDFVDEGTLAWIEPARLEIPVALRENALKAKDSWRMYSIPMKQKCLEANLPLIRTF